MGLIWRLKKVAKNSSFWRKIEVINSEFDRNQLARGPIFRHLGLTPAFRQPAAALARSTCIAIVSAIAIGVHTCGEGVCSRC